VPGSPDGTALATLLAVPAPEAALVLLGCTLSHRAPEGTVTVRLTEVEAYAGEDDPASHAWRGPTRRTAVMFGPAGHLYVYFSYGMHFCGNVVVGTDGHAAAVLLRAGEVVEGEDLAQRRRGPAVEPTALGRGPANLMQALGVDRSHDGAPLLRHGELVLAHGDPVDPSRVRTGPRVGVSRAADVPWRFWLAGEPSVSAYRRSPRA
jgi:DNA-3-methyladenine glycosylase